MAPMARLAAIGRVAGAWCLLVAMDIALKTIGFDRFYRMLRWWPTVGTVAPRERAERTEVLCAALQRARIYYPKYAWCLQSAAAGVCFLRLHGIRAEIVIGVRRVPFYAHAWIEVDGEVVHNNRPQLRELHGVIARC